MTIRLGLALAALVFGGIVAWSGFTLYRLNLLLEAEELDIYETVLLDLGRKLESGLRPGEPLAVPPAVQGLLERERAKSVSVRRITVFTPTGLILFDTDRTRIGSKVPQSWVEEAWEPGRLIWISERGGLRSLERVIRHADGTAAGVLVLMGETGVLKGFHLEAMRALGLQIILTIVLVAGLALLMARWLSRRWYRLIEPGKALLLPLAYGGGAVAPMPGWQATPATTPADAMPASPTALEPVNRLATQMHSVLDDLEKADRELERLLGPR